MRTLADLGEIASKRVLVRVDFNVPLEAGEITDDTRIRAALPTLDYLRERGARVILAAHLGRPQGADPALSLRPLADRLGALIGAPVKFAGKVVGAEVEQEVERLEPGEVLLLENLRYERGETENDAALAERLAALADVYVNDAFGAAHRAHASTDGVARLMPIAVAGFLLQREVEQLEAILAAPKRPLVAIVGGAKVTDKVGVIERFLELADTILIGGAMCFPFLQAQGHAVGASLCERDGVGPARRALERAATSERCELLLPVDLVIGERFAADSAARGIDSVDVPEGWMGLDIGPRTAALYTQRIAQAGTIFWNGPMGAFELEPFAAGTRAVAQAVAAAPALSVVGGGDSAAALVKFGLADSIAHLSTGGGASLELIEGHTLPGVEALT